MQLFCEILNLNVNKACTLEDADATKLSQANLHFRRWQRDTEGSKHRNRTLFHGTLGKALEGSIEVHSGEIWCGKFENSSLRQCSIQVSRNERVSHTSKTKMIFPVPALETALDKSSPCSKWKAQLLKRCGTLKYLWHRVTSRFWLRRLFWYRRMACRWNLRNENIEMFHVQAKIYIEFDWNGQKNTLINNLQKT